MLFIRGTGPIGYPGGAEVVNMQPPAALIKRACGAALHRRWPAIGHLRLALDPQRLARGGGGRGTRADASTGDRVRIDLEKRTRDMLISDAELAERRAALESTAFPFPRARRLGRRSSASMVAQFDEGMVLKPAIELPAPRADRGAPTGQSLTGVRRSHI